MDAIFVVVSAELKILEGCQQAAVPLTFATFTKPFGSVSHAHVTIVPLRHTQWLLKTVHWTLVYF